MVNYKEEKGQKKKVVFFDDTVFSLVKERRLTVRTKTENLLRNCKKEKRVLNGDRRRPVA